MESLGIDIDAEEKKVAIKEWMVISAHISFLSVPVLFPDFVSSYFLRTSLSFFFFLVMTGCLNILGGRSGYLNLGQGVIAGIGAYGTGLMVQSGFPWWISLAAVSFAGLIWSLITAPFLFRLKGETFALVNLALLFIFLAMSRKLRVLTGGSDGLLLISGPDYMLAFYGQGFLSLIVIFVSLEMPWTRTGYQVRMMGLDSFLAESIGVSTFRIKLKIYSFCSFILTASGGFFMLGEGYIIPSTVFGISTSLLPVAMAMVGGLGEPLGAVWGTLFVFFLQEWLWLYMGIFEQSFLGVVLIFAGKRKIIVQYMKKHFQ